MHDSTSLWFAAGIIGTYLISFPLFLMGILGLRAWPPGMGVYEVCAFTDYHYVA